MRIVSILFVMIPLLGQAQDNEDSLAYLVQSHRLEVDYDYEQTYHLAGAGEDGLVLLQKSRERQRDGYEWIFVHVDTIFQEMNRQITTIPYGSVYLRSVRRSGSVFILFAVINDDVYKTFTIIHFDLGRGQITRHELDMTFPLEFHRFAVLEDRAIFTGYTNGRTLVSLFDMNTGGNKIIPGFYQKKSNLLDLETNPSNRTFSILYTEPSNIGPGIVMKTYSNAGRLLTTSTLVSEEDAILVHNQFTEMPDGVQYFTGTYRSRKSGPPQGFYVAKLINGRQQFLKFHAFTALQAFMEMAPEEADEGEGTTIPKKRPTTNREFHFHDVMVQDGLIYLVGETYASRFIRSTVTQDNVQLGIAFTASETRVIERRLYNYDHALLIALSQDAEVVWDTDMAIDRLEIYELRDNIKLTFRDQFTGMMYLHDGTIRSQMNEQSRILHTPAYVPLKLGSEAEIVVGTIDDSSGLNTWYGNNFYHYGIHSIRDTSTDRQREVFYVNKIEVR